MDKGIQIFLSYAQEDRLSAKEIKKYLTFLRRQGRVTVWDTDSILAGQEREQAIREHLENAQIILLLISPNFLASSAQRKELDLAVERHEQGTAYVIPIMLHPTYVNNTSLASLAILPKSGKSIAEWKNRDLAYLDIVEEIERTILQVDASNKKTGFKNFNA